MPDDCEGGCSGTEQSALAWLCFTVGVSVDMDYGHCPSSTYTYKLLTALPEYFRYDPTIDREERADHSPDGWFDIVQEEIFHDRPMVYRIIGHAVVCDGWRIEGDLLEYHINYGWGGSHTGWYTIDHIYGSEDPLQEYMIRRIFPKEVHTVEADGSGDFPTIQAAIDGLRDGYVIELGDGVFTGEGNRDLVPDGKTLTIRSRSGDPETCVIDCGGSPSDPHQAIILHNYDHEGITVESITIRNGYSDADDGSDRGGAVCAGWSGWPYPPEVNIHASFNGCIFENNRSLHSGGAVYGVNCSPEFNDCIFRNNAVTSMGNNYEGGGAVNLAREAPIFRRCVFEDNYSAGCGGAVSMRLGCQAEFQDCLFAGNTAHVWGGAVSSTQCKETFDGCVFTGNESEYAGPAIWFFDPYWAAPYAHLEGCLFTGNVAPAWMPSCIACKAGKPEIRSCTIADNVNGGIWIYDYEDEASAVVIDDCIIAFNSGTEGISCTGASTVTLSCCDVFGNEGGDWVGYIAGQYGMNGNICEDPLFCYRPAGDYTIRSDSPCAPYSDPNPECGLIGAYDVGCEPVIRVCCLGTECLLVSEEECGNLGGEWMSDFEECDPNPCEWSGAEDPASSVPQQSEIASLSPNPASVGTRIRCGIPEGRKGSLVVVDARGRKVWERKDLGTGGWVSVGWSCRDLAGRPVPAGLYYVILKDGVSRQSRRVLVVR